MNDFKLVKTYLNNQCTDEEAKRAIEFISNNKGNRVLNKLIEESWKDSQETQTNPSKLEETYNELEAIIDSEGIPLKRKPIQSTYNHFVKYAASILMLLVLTYGVYEYNKVLPALGQVSVEIKNITKRTTNGQKSTIILKDGSKVILNSASSIQYPQFFSDSSRTIELDGEAFFEVAVDKKRPFIVTSGGVQTIALGTSFNINTKNPDLVKVSLATGKVMVSHQSPNESEIKSEPYFLAPGEALRVNRNDSKVVKYNFDAEEDLLWKEGVLYFKDYSFLQIVEKLEPWYDVKFQIQNEKLMSKKYTGKFDNVSLNQLLKNVGFTLGFDFFINDKNVTIIFNNK